ncbi:MAG: RecQ family ATP-dependent DNA helicase [Flavobacteriales bacterium]|nr:RecQ family ATP-dependent DNA helicase [Flavobacteriales bacterium]
MSDYHYILKQYWNYNSFRPNQEEIIQTALAQKDVLALLPTGGGKSICYQVPAMQMEGICLVVSPLIALMYDQVEQLKKRGIKAAAVSSALSKKEIDHLLDNACYDPQLKFLYVSPERLKTDIFRKRFEKMPVNLIAVDEAHCISQWGYDFRPSYLNIAELRAIKKNVPIMAVTATATKEVVGDIQEKLLFRSKKVIKSSFERPNLQYKVVLTENKLNRIAEFINKRKDSGIIYCSTRKNVKSLFNYLQSKGFSVDFYHGGLNFEERQQKQKDWFENQRRIMITTNAFGMGIDKSDVRFVLHYDVPDNLESYYQEAGRAGRDQEKAEVVAYYEKMDLQRMQEKNALKYPGIDEIRNVYKALGNHFQLAIGSGEGESFPLELGEFCQKYEMSILPTYNCIKLLEMGGFIQLIDHPNPQSKIHFKVDAKALYSIQVRDNKLDKIIKYILRTHIGVFDEYVWFNEYKVAKKLGISLAHLLKNLSYLQQNGIIDFERGSAAPKILFIHERLNENNVSLSPELYKNRKLLSQQKLESIFDYLQTTECRDQFLLNYFGANSKTNCGRCDNCLEKLNTSSPQEQIKNQILQTLKTVEKIDLQQLISQNPNWNRDAVFETLNWLSDHQLVTINEKEKTVKLIS